LKNLDDYDPLEKLAILAPAAIDTRHIPSGWQHLTPADIAGRLSKVSRPASMLGRVKIAGELDLIRDLLFELQVAIAGTIIKPGTNKERPLIGPMSKLAISEVISPKTCRWCKGRKWVLIDNKQSPCEGCDGKGTIPYTERSRARACDIPHESWRRKYSRVYIEVLTVPLTWENEVREALK